MPKSVMGVSPSVLLKHLLKLTGFKVVLVISIIVRLFHLRPLLSILLYGDMYQTTTLLNVACTRKWAIAPDEPLHSISV